jgi:hypothetical protein
VESLQLYIYSFVDSIVNLCNCCYLDSTRIMCMFDVHIMPGGRFPKRHRACCGVIATIRKVPVLGRHKWYQSSGFVDAHGSSLPVG